MCAYDHTIEAEDLPISEFGARRSAWLCELARGTELRRAFQEHVPAVEECVRVCVELRNTEALCTIYMNGHVYY